MEGDTECWTYLYVSQWEQDWEYERERLKDGEAYAYVEWLDAEHGYVGVAPKNGGVSRTY